MNLFTVAFAGSTVTLLYDTKDAREFLRLLFRDVTQQTRGDVQQHQLSLLADKGLNEYRLQAGNTQLCRGRLGVRFAAHLYDTVIFHLLNRAENGIALHAGAVICNDLIILLPGQSGAGKSTLTSWLTCHNCSYLTDELIFISIHAPREIKYFSRPLCLKPGSMHLFEELLASAQKDDFLMDLHGAVIPHRLLNPEFKEPQAPPSLIIMPDYAPESDPELEPISSARLGTLLMGCHVNARNLIDHGFREVLEIARSTPAFRLRYNSLQDASSLLDAFLQE